jgi:UDP-N-acetyl-D-glucosamine dehydrogenase
LTEDLLALKSRIESRKALVGVIGLGYVGLPLSLAFVRAGFRVLGFDIDKTKTEQLEHGESYIGHIDGTAVAAAVETGKLAATSEFSRLGEPDALLICVPTPLTAQREPDMTYVARTAEQIGKTLRPGQLVVLESTTYPGATEEVLEKTLEASGLVSGKDFFVAYSPEREDPGNPDFGTTTIPKLVGGVDETAAELAEALYRQVVVETVRVSSARAAEAAKLLENIFRSVNIALVNELKIVYEAMGIDIWEVLDAAATKPFGFMRFNPGPGWGGHCIPIDPFYLSWKARQYGASARFIELAGEVNVQMPGRVVRKLQDALNDQGKTLQGSKVLVLGLAYKKDVGDPRESPAFEVLSRLAKSATEVSYHDPFIPEAPTMRSWEDLGSMRSQPLTAATLAGHDAVVIVTDHSEVDYDLVLEHSQLIIDTRGVYRDESPNVVRA